MSRIVACRTAPFAVMDINRDLIAYGVVIVRARPYEAVELFSKLMLGASIFFNDECLIHERMQVEPGSSDGCFDYFAVRPKKYADQKRLSDNVIRSFQEWHRRGFPQRFLVVTDPVMQAN